MPSAIIADDEDLPRSELRRLLAQVWPALNVLAECEHGADALDAIGRLQPDIAFLDIRMPGLSGLDVARVAGSRCRVVFVTAYDEHAFEAFEAGAIDYLRKPVERARLVGERPAGAIDRHAVAHVAIDDRIDRQAHFSDAPLDQHAERDEAGKDDRDDRAESK